MIDSDAGLVRLTGTVDGFDELGIPTVDFEDAEILLDVGSRNSGEEVDAAICSVLAA